MLAIGIGLGFGLPCPWVMRELAVGRGLPMLFGFHAYGGGPFERYRATTFIALLSVFMLLCALEVTAGSLLWGQHKSGALLALGLLPLSTIFWWGFALPIPPTFALLRTLLIVLAWGRLVGG